MLTKLKNWCYGKFLKCAAYIAGDQKSVEALDKFNRRKYILDVAQVIKSSIAKKAQEVICVLNPSEMRDLEKALHVIFNVDSDSQIKNSEYFFMGEYYKIFPLPYLAVHIIESEKQPRQYSAAKTQIVIIPSHIAHTVDVGNNLIAKNKIKVVVYKTAAEVKEPTK